MLFPNEVRKLKNESHDMNRQFANDSVPNRIYLQAAHGLTLQDRDNIRLKGHMTNYEDVGILRSAIFTTGVHFCFNKLFELKKLLLHES